MVARTWQAVAVALAGGLALDAAFPPAGFWPLAAVGPALLVIALWRRSLRGSFLIGLVFGLAFFVPLLSWVLNVAWYAWAALAGADTRDPRRGRGRPAAAAAAARLAAGRGGLVGGGRVAARPLAATAASRGAGW